MRLKLQPMEGLIILKTDEDKLKTVFIVGADTKTIFSYKINNTNEMIVIPILYDENRRVLVVDNKEYFEDTVLDLVEDQKIENYIFLEGKEVDCFEDLSKKIKK